VSPAFRKRTSQEAPEDAIPEDLLASIPDLAPAGDATAEFADAPAADAASPEALHRLVLDMRRQMETTLGRELDRVEQSFSGLVESLEQRLAEAQARAQILQEENDSLLRKEVAYQQRFAKLRELTKDLERP